MPLSRIRVTNAKYQFLLEIQRKLSDWNASSLSMAGRITLAKAVIAAIPNYFMQTTLLLVSVINEIETIIRRFVWGAKEGKTKFALSRWLGFPKAKEHNKAFLCKLGFRVLIKRGDLWVDILCEKYHVGDFIPDSVVTGNCSFLWWSLAKIWDKIRPNIFVSIRDDKCTSFWFEDWIPELGLLWQHQKPGVMIPNEWKVVDVVTNNHDWNWEVLDKFLTPSALLHISNIYPPNPFVGEDNIAWKGAKEGAISHIWALKCPQRVRNFVWLACQGKILTNEERLRRGLTNNEACGLCGTHQESVLHFLRDCRMIKSVWREVVAPTKQGVFFSLSLTEWLNANICSSVKFNNEDFSWYSIFSIVCWFAWKYRNDLVFNGGFFIWARHAAGAGHSRSKQSNNRSAIAVKWILPPMNWIKFNTDGAWDSMTGIGKAGGVIRNSEDSWLAGYNRLMGVSFIHNAELWAIFDGLTLT
uniref:Reverse transcriptase zinc-binding domain-containing protein n=1 Tax=Manihot esculenta TaxID=3983 RepID=A0A2C9W680_MANES